MEQKILTKKKIAIFTAIPLVIYEIISILTPALVPSITTESIEHTSMLFDLYQLIATVLGTLVFMLFGQYMLLPVVGFTACISMGRKGGKLAFLTPLIVIAANLVIALAVFGTIDVVFLITGAVPAAVGCVIGLIFKKKK